MRKSFKLLEKIDKAHPGFLEDCKELGREVRGGLDLDLEDFNCLREKHGVSRGLGDTIAKVTKGLGIKPCGGCKKRQAKLNKSLPYS
tara:strand:+ start:252 stop:512 length:261 start_codon:yes stop_codon:yes gene_type:complete